MADRTLQEVINAVKALRLTTSGKTENGGQVVTFEDSEKGVKISLPRTISVVSKLSKGTIR